MMCHPEHYNAVKFIQTQIIIVEEKGLDRRWAPRLRQRCDCGDHVGCKQEVCVNTNGRARSFPSVCRADIGTEGWLSSVVSGHLAFRTTDMGIGRLRLAGQIVNIYRPILEQPRHICIGIGRSLVWTH